MDALRKLGLAGLLLLYVGCRPSAGTSVVVTVTGQVPAFDHLAITLTAGATVRTPPPIVQSAIPPDILFGIDVPRAVKGPLHVQVDADSADGTILFSAADDVALSPGQLKTLTLTLGNPPAGDGGPTDDLSMVVATGDLSTADLTPIVQPPDLAPVVPAVVTLSGSRPMPNATLTTRKFIDLNGDGKLDLLDYSTNQFNVTLNRGDGVFGITTTHTGNGLLAPLDLNGDGLLDFIGNNTGSISIYLNDGHGVYPLTNGAAQTSTPGQLITNMQIADLNKDGKPDLFCFISVPTGTPNVDIFLNNGSGVFPASPSNTLLLPGSATSLVALTDLTGDSAADLFITVSATDWHTYVNDGTGQFGPQSSPQPAFNSLPNGGFQFKDVSGDGKVDVVFSVASNMDVILGNGDGTFGATLGAYSSGGSVVSNFTLVDLNGDTKPDVVLRNGSNVIEAMLNNGSGAFGTAATLTTGATASSFQVADLNGDTKPEVIALESGGGIDIFINNGSGVFASRAPYAPNANTTAVILADINHDTYLDLLCPRSVGFGVFLNNGSGVFGALADTVTPSAPQFVDLTGDAQLDAFGATGTNVWYSLNNGSGVFGAVVSGINVFNASNLSSADLNGDGRADITGYDSYIATTSGAPDFPIQVATTAAPISVVIGDFKADGKPDIVTTYGSNIISAFINNGDATFAGQKDYMAGTTTARLAAGHVKSAANLDVVVSNSGTSNVSLLTGEGDGTFDPKNDYPISTTPGPVVLADVNNDTFDDLVVALPSQVGVLLNNGSGIFSQEKDYAGIGTIRILAADLNGDHHPDLVTVSSGTVSSLINDGTGVFSGKNDYTWPSASVNNSRLIDLTGDGILDLVTSINMPANGMLNLRANNGNGTFAMPSDLVAGTLFAFGDLNRDGRPDLVVGFTNTVRVLIQDASGTFVAGGEYDVPTPAFLEIADFDGDGLGDVLVGGGGLGSQLYVLKNISK